MGLLSMIRVLGTIPIIRAARGGAADMLAQTLYKSLCENITTRSPVYSLFADCLVSSNAATSDSNGSKPLTSNRPLLLIFDRNADLNPPLMHSSSYQSLMDDLLDHRLNRVTIELNSKNNDAKKKTYDVNTHTDPFFANYATASFPDAVEANEKELGD